jgi:hypothetical protein
MLVLAMSMSASAAKAKISKKSQTIAVGDSFTLKLKNAKGKVKWSSSNKSVATVSKGKVTGISGGGATITAKNNKKTYKCAVTVEEVKLEGITSPIELAIGAKVDLKGFIKVYPNDLPLDITSSDTSIATVANGEVTAVKTGDATITLKSKTTSAQTTLAVKVKGLAEDEAKKEQAGVEVINDDNFNEKFHKYFGRVVITELYLDKNGNVLNPENYIAGTVRTEKETAKFNSANNDPDKWIDYDTRRGDINHDGGSKYDEHNDEWRWDYYPVMDQTYAYYIKDGNVNDLMTYGASMMQYHLNTYAVNIAGTRPVFAAAYKSTVPLGAVTPRTYQTGYGYVRINASEKVELARMFFPKAGATPIYYDYRTQHNGYRRMAQGTKLVLYTEDAKLQKPVTGVDNRAMLGFDFAHVRTTFGRDLSHEPWKQHSKVNFDETTDVLKSVDMIILEDDVFRNVDFHLYMKSFQR